MAIVDFAYSAAGADGAGQPGLAVFADRPHVRGQLCDDALMAGFTIVSAEAVGRLGAVSAAALAQVVLVDCPVPDAASLAALTRLDMEVRRAGTQLIVATSVDGLDDVFGCLDQSQPQLLVEPGPADFALALARARALMPGRRVRELADEDRLQLLRLTEQVGQLAARLGEGPTSRLEAGRLASPVLAFRGHASADDGVRLSGVPVTLPDARLVRRILRQRQQRARFFDGDLFADPAWDMLLDLTAARAEHKRVSVASLCIASGVPPTTALRWIGQMTHSGLFERVEDTGDRRRAFIALTQTAADGMAGYFATVATAPAVPI